jgi:anti-sigma B factor antagonist
VVRCQGDLTIATAETLRRNLALLISGGHESLLVNVSGLRRLDAQGSVALLEAARSMAARGRRFILVAGRDPAADFLRVVGFARLVPVCRSEEEALALLDGPTPPAPPDWETARRQTLERWDRILAKVGVASPAEITRDLTDMFALCHRADAIARLFPGSGLDRCHFCPLFYRLGGGPEETGCSRELDALLECVERKDWRALRGGIAKLRADVAGMPLPE